MYFPIPCFSCTTKSPFEISAKLFMTSPFCFEGDAAFDFFFLSLYDPKISPSVITHFFSSGKSMPAVSSPFLTMTLPEIPALVRNSCRFSILSALLAAIVTSYELSRNLFSSRSNISSLPLNENICLLVMFLISLYESTPLTALEKGEQK